MPDKYISIAQHFPPLSVSSKKWGKLKNILLIASGFLLSLFLILATIACSNNILDSGEASPGEEVIEAPGLAETTAANQDKKEAANNAPDQNTAYSDSDEQYTDNQVVLIEHHPITFNQDGVSFIYPGAFFGLASIEHKKGSPDNDIGPYPDYTIVSFDYFILQNSLWAPNILVFSTYEFRAIYEYAAETIDLLEAILADSQKITDAEELPYLPSLNAAQVFHSKTETIEFKNGKGLRYLTFYAQDYGPITNEMLIYTYQGITVDGRCYVSMSIPVNHPKLPADYDSFYKSNPKDLEDMRKNYLGFVAQTARMLEESDQGQFNPPLAVLDEMIKTLEIK